MSCGVYKIVNRVNGNFYIGSSNNIEKRWTTHKNDLKKKKHHCIPLQRAYNKYGKSALKFKIIKLCSENELLKIEQFYLDKFKPVYNISKDAIAPMKGRKHSKSTIRKFKKRKYPRGPDNPNYGKKFSKERRKKAADARRGYKHSPKTKKKMRKTAIKNEQHKYLMPYIDNIKKKVKDNLGNIFNSMTEAAAFHRISIQTCCDILKGRHFRTRKKVSFEYI